MQPRPMTTADLPRAGALSAAVGWNQVEADWRHFLDGGRAVAVDDGHPTCLAATAAALPFGPDLAWISMVLVRPDRRRGGLATGLIRSAVGALAGTRCIALDATPADVRIERASGHRLEELLPGGQPAPLTQHSIDPFTPSHAGSMRRADRGRTALATSVDEPTGCVCRVASHGSAGKEALPPPVGP